MRQSYGPCQYRTHEGQEHRVHLTDSLPEVQPVGIGNRLPFGHFVYIVKDRSGCEQAANMSHGVLRRPVHCTLVAMTGGLRVNPISPPTIQIPIKHSRERLVARLPAIVSATACNAAPLAPAPSSTTAKMR